MRADRLLSIMLLLHRKRRMTAQSLAEQLEVSERTIYRDVDALSAAGVPVYTQSGVNGGIFLDENYRVSLTGLSQEQVMALFIPAEAGPLADLGLSQMDSLLKLFAALPDAHRQEVERLRQRFYIDPMGWYQAGSDVEVLAQLQEAVWDDQRVSMSYQPVAGGIYTFDLDAYALVAKATIWYLVGRKPNGDYRTYRLSRIYALTPLDEHFERDADFDLMAHWEQSRAQFIQQMEQQFPLYAVTLRVHPQMFWYFGSFLEGRFKQVGEADEDGWLIVKVTFGSREEAMMHVMGLGRSAWVMEPESLRDVVLAQAKLLCEYY